MEVDRSGDAASNRPGSLPMLPESLDTLSSLPLEASRHRPDKTPLQYTSPRLVTDTAKT